ncbi:SAM-dependent methyltransferase [Beijerinckia indica]|uniref:Cyclopropane-fatty-acyl-phospholipid synthase n=1 Tax=Beijerinckia indica subsp. indica (strain ATCC 9039 / DSM 1715 / NCIMB 8712) TaxID=395963 RepID=B2IF74_BEII9|nr:cyclopropane-fatty-acyl-phospholipid synthase family protein [Beijerinckia indica]ACB95639.1 Cyclopropane-fatty-acyl-phospholipid synthase [Beijerinckia indica subsp. indica ATCC 9039]
MIKNFTTFVSENIKTGDLVIIEANGCQHHFGDGTGKRVTIRFTDNNILLAILLKPELAAGEAFMDGRLLMVEGDIYDFLALIFRNTYTLKTSRPIKLIRQLINFTKRFNANNKLGNAQKNIAYHYDLDQSFYRLFLDEDCQYSCAYFEYPGETLDAAQSAKKRHIAAKLLLKSNQHVLDIGSGWGGLGLYLARLSGVEVTGVTLSKEQYISSNKEAERLNLAHHVRFFLKDYRLLDETFDRIVSVGMLEHVGIGSYEEYFAKVKSLLKPDGVMLLHAIGQFDSPTYTNPWIQKYIFPGGYIPALSEVLPAIERHGLVVCDIEILRLHYAETLRAWRERFLARREEAVALYGERFARMWEFYLAASETAFRYQGLMVFQIQLARDQTVVPLTRNYIAKNEEALKTLENAKLFSVLTPEYSSAKSSDVDINSDIDIF